MNNFFFFSLSQRVEFPMPSNNYSFSLANRHWDLLADEVHNQLFSFDKVIDQTSINFYNLILDTAPQI